ncbi:Phosphatidylinositol (PI) 3-kinase [Chytriomyces hyalinus]|nr:Phosphatidylinositol (PI) 3-kinase [Chytriomyces hyalinus]
MRALGILTRGLKSKERFNAVKFTTYSLSIPSYNTDASCSSFLVDSFNCPERMYKDKTLPCMARGLFTISHPNEEAMKRPILVRGYDKFFNLGEVESTTEEYLRTKTVGPYEVTVKENGCIIYITGFKKSLIVTSKHALHAPLEATGKFANEGEDKITHAQKGEEWAKTHLKTKGKTEEEFATFLEDHNVTAVFELADDEFEEHILEYPEGRRGLYLHGINENEIFLNTWNSIRVRQVAEQFGFLSVESEVLDSFEEVMALADNCRATGSFNNRPVEGFVVRCMSRDTSLTTMFKIKYDEPYLMFREWREITTRLIKNQPFTPKYRISERYAYWCEGKLISHPDMFSGFLQHRGIIAARNLFLLEEGVEESWSSLLHEAESRIPAASPHESNEEVEVQDDGAWETVASRHPNKKTGLKNDGPNTAQGSSSGGGSGDDGKSGGGRENGSVVYPEVLGPADPSLAGSEKILILPMAIVGLGKTTLGRALKGLYHKSLHTIQKDNHKKKESFLTRFMEAFETFDVVYVDRNNHLEMHREEIGRRFREIYPGGRILGVEWLVKGEGAAMRQRDIVALSTQRIEKRGEDHQNLTPLKTPQYAKIVNGFYRDFTRVSCEPGSVDSRVFNALVSISVESSLSDRVRAVARALRWDVDETVRGENSASGNQLVDYSFAITSDVNHSMGLRIATITGVKARARAKIPTQHALSDPVALYNAINSRPALEPFIVCQLYASNRPLSPPMRTPHRSFSPSANEWTWNEWITFPVKYRDLPHDACLAFTVWDVSGPQKAMVLGGATFALFGENSTVKKGKHKLKLWLSVEADGTVDTITPGEFEAVKEVDRLEKLVRDYELGDIPRIDWMDRLTFREIESVFNDQSASMNEMYLYIELPKFDFPLIYHEKEYSLPPSIIPLIPNTAHIFRKVYDPEASRGDNPVENKHRKLGRSHRNGPLDRDLKPNAKIRDEMNKILQYPPTEQLSSEASDLLWKFRFFLTRDKKALTKFLKCVVWDDAVESRQAVELLHGWVDIDVEDALELLGAGFENRGVRGYAVGQLRKADDEELQLYLLQLVQALKFENIANTNGITESPLAQFLIQRAVANRILGNYLYWYLMVECEDKVCGRIYEKMVDSFIHTMAESADDGPQRRNILKRQVELVATLAKISKQIRTSSESRPKKIELLRATIADPKNGLSSFPPIPLPLDAHVIVTGIIPEKCNIFKSALLPLRLVFQCADGRSEYPVIFKTGDDMRQDQLVVQVFTLMDRLLRKENLDLRLTTYKVLATGSDQGMVQFIPSTPLATILSEYGNSLTAYLKQHNLNETGNIPPAVMDTYIRSCAGYCVMTYLLGIGDRHLDNLLLTTGGNLFHIDFGYILGRDPKPFPPPMKLSKEMVDVMGGGTSQSYQNFKTYCFVAFNSLRKSANLILNLFALMVNANVPDIRVEPDKVVLKVQEKFKLELNDEEAIQFFQALINESVGAVFPQVMERIHGLAMMLRS